MSEVKWIKLSIDVFSDEKIKLIETLPDADTILIIWIKLMTLAGRINDGGKIYLSRNMNYTPEALATILNRPVNTVKLALETFVKFEMIETDSKGLILLSNWRKHQNIEGLEKIKEQTRKRVRKHREKKKLTIGDDVTLPITQGNATEERRKDEKEELEKETKKEDREGGGIKQPPSLDDVIEYALENSYDRKEAESFFCYYEDRNWYSSGQYPIPITNWQMKLKQWIIKRDNFTNPNIQEKSKVIEIRNVN